MNRARRELKTDDLIPIVEKVLVELKMVSGEVMARPVFEDGDAAKIGLIELGLQEILKELEADMLTGKNGVYQIAVHIHNKYEDVILRMEESGAFPEFMALIDII